MYLIKLKHQNNYKIKVKMWVNNQIKKSRRSLKIQIAKLKRFIHLNSNKKAMNRYNNPKIFTLYLDRKSLKESTITSFYKLSLRSNQP